VAAATVGAGEDQSHPPRPCRSQTGGSDPASLDVCEKIPDKHADVERNSRLRTRSSAPTLLVDLATMLSRSPCAHEEFFSDWPAGSGGGRAPMCAVRYFILLCF